MNPRKTAFAIAAALTLSACASTSAGPTKALPPAFMDAAMEAAFAETIAEECRSLDYSSAHENKMLSAEALRLAAAGYTERDLDAAVARMDRDPVLRRKAIKMILDHKIDVASEASWCAAGRRAKARGTDIGRYLI